MKTYCVVIEPATVSVLEIQMPVPTEASNVATVPPKAVWTVVPSVPMPSDPNVPVPMAVEFAPVAPIVRMTHVKTRDHGALVTTPGVVRATVETPSVGLEMSKPIRGVNVSVPVEAQVINPPARTSYTFPALQSLAEMRVKSVAAQRPSSPVATSAAPDAIGGSTSMSAKYCLLMVSSARVERDGELDRVADGERDAREVALDDQHAGGGCREAPGIRDRLHGQRRDRADDLVLCRGPGAGRRDRPCRPRFGGFRKERRVGLRAHAGARPPADEVPIEGRDPGCPVADPLFAEVRQYGRGHQSSLVVQRPGRAE